MSVHTTPMLVLRHGESEWNAVRRWQGRADTPLTDLGRRQAALCAHHLATLQPLGRVWSSSLQRAAQTASIIATHLDLGEIVTDERLCEADAGEWEGLTPDEIDRKYPGFRANDRRPSSFEPFDSVVERSVAALRDVAATQVESTVARPPLVVAHSGVLRSIVRRLGRRDERIPNLAGVWLRVAPTEAPTGVHDTGIGIGIQFGERFRPAGLVATSFDGPGEAPGNPAGPTGY